jgi:hypothetical protein
MASANRIVIIRTPTRRMRSACARATTGQAAAPPSPAMNSRRRMFDPLHRFHGSLAPSEWANQSLGRQVLAHLGRPPSAQGESGYRGLAAISAARCFREYGLSPAITDAVRPHVGADRPAFGAHHVPR